MTTLTRRNYKKARALRAGKTLQELIVAGLRSSIVNGLTFNQLRSLLAKSLKIDVSNFILKRELASLRATRHVSRKNAHYYATSKSHFSKSGRGKQTRRQKKKKLGKRQQRARRARFTQVRKSLATQSGKFVHSRRAVLEKVVLKAMRSLKRAHKCDGFVFNTIKARIHKLTNKQLRNVVIVRTLQALRATGQVHLINARNYLVKPKAAKSKAMTKKTRSKKRSVSARKTYHKKKRVGRSKRVCKRSKRRSKASTKPRVTVIGKQLACDAVRAGLLETDAEIKAFLNEKRSQRGAFKF